MVFLNGDRRVTVTLAKVTAGAAVIGLCALFSRPPSLEDVWTMTELDPEGQFVQFGDVRYTTRWGDEVEFTGLVRDLERAYYPGAPMITHNVLVTTGDYSDPSLVDCSPLDGGSMRWRADERPLGTLEVLHVIPADDRAFELLTDLETGREVTIAGCEELDHEIQGSDGSWMRFGRARGHVLLLATDVRPAQPDSTAP